MKPESIVAMGHVYELTDEINRLLLSPDEERENLNQAHRLTSAANGLMLTVLLHELLDDDGEGSGDLAQQLFQGQTIQ